MKTINTEFTDKPIFPNVKVKYGTSDMELTTYLRKEKDGKWYVQKISERFDFGKFKYNSADVDNVYQRFIKSCYIVSVLGIVDPKLFLPDYNGEMKPAFTPDESTLTEAERLSNILKNQLQPKE